MRILGVYVDGDVAQLPSDAEDGINYVAVTSLINTSPFQVDLGTCVFALSYRTSLSPIQDLLHSLILVQVA